MSPELNSEQAAAVEALAGPILIQAGAGTGKTKTLTERFVRALEDSVEEEWSAARVNEVLTITFTDKAAGELSERVRKSLRERGRFADALATDSGWISTIHGLCSRILRRHALEAGLDPEFRIIDAVDDWRLKEEAFEEAASCEIETASEGFLLSEIGFTELFHVVDRVVRAMRMRGLTAADLVSEETSDPREIAAQVIESFGSAAARIESCGVGGKNAASLSEKCRGTVCSLEQLDSDGVEDADLARGVWEALEEWKPGGRAAGAAEAVRVEIKEERARLQLTVAACVAHPYEQAFVSLVNRYAANYARYKAERSLLDFDDLQARTADLLMRRPDVLQEYREMFRLVMVDEFQDTDGLQLSIVNALSGNDLCTVGDEHQSIYRFRGADVDVYRAHNEQMEIKGGRRFELTTNYRSHSAVLDFINRLFSASESSDGEVLDLKHGRAEPELSVLPESEPRVDLLVIDASDASAAELRAQEARGVAQRFVRLRDEFGVDPSGMVVLMRAYTHAQIYARALRACGFDVVVAGGGRLLTRPEVKGIRALIRTIANPADEMALCEVLASDIGRMSDDGLWRLTRDPKDARREGVWTTLGRAEEILDGEDRANAVRTRQLLQDARAEVGREPLGDVILRAVEASRYDLVLLASGTEGQHAFANVRKLVRMAHEYEAAGGAGPAGFAAYLDDRERFGEHTVLGVVVEEGSRAVRIMSVHASKGLEFPVVAVVETGATRRVNQDVLRAGVGPDGLLKFAIKPPLRARNTKSGNRSATFSELDSVEKIADDEESKRLFYVACTRAQEVLIVSGTADCESAPSEGTLTMMSGVRVALGATLFESARGQGVTTIHFGEHPIRLEVAQGAAEEENFDDGAAAESPPAAGCTSECFVAPSKNVCDAPQERAIRHLAPERLSYSDIVLFDSCELRFHAERVLRVGRLAWSDGVDPARFGSAVHLALQLSSAGRVPDADRMQAISQRFDLGAVETSALGAAVETFVSSETAHALDSHEVVRREWAFTMRVAQGSEEVDFVGALDAYGKTGQHGMVVDYKTGTSGEPADLEERYRLQARCYALVALADGCSTVTVVFSRPQVRLPSGLMQEVRYEFTPADAPGIEKEILDVHRRMGEYAPSPLKRWAHATCAGCPVAGGVCPRVAPKGHG